MTQITPWAGKVLALIKNGNTQAAIAQIKVAPSVKDLKDLRNAILAVKQAGHWRDVDTAIADNLALLAAPRLHRSP